MTQNPTHPSGDSSELLNAVHAELRDVAAAYMRRERPDHTLQPTALVSEAYLRLAKSGLEPVLERTHILGIAARVMRQVLVDHARAAGAQKRGGGWHRMTLTGLDSEHATDPIDLLALEDALQRLGQQDPRLVQIVEHRYFGGLSIADTAEALNTTMSRVESDWAFARSWLRRELGGGGSS